MVFKFITFDPEDEYLNNHPGSPPYYGPSSSSADSSPAVSVCNGCLGGNSVAQPSDPVQRFSSPVQVQQPRNRGRDDDFFSTIFNNPKRYYSNRRDDRKSLHKSRDKQGSSTEQGNGSKQGVGGNLVLFDNCTWAFGLKDLLRAPGEVLLEDPHWKEYASPKDWLEALDEMRRKETYWRRYASLKDLLGELAEENGLGSHRFTYKASLEDSTTVVVKRLKNIGNVTMTQLTEHMELLGQIMHENVAALRGYLISRDTTLMLYDYYSQGSVSSMMHGQGYFFNWERRKKIVIGAVRGIAYIHRQNGGKLFHGNLTSSNVFINSQGYGCVSEICCNTLKSGESPYVRYNPNMREASQASDKYGLGLLMLELIFGCNPLTQKTAGGIFSTEYYDNKDGLYKFDGGLPYRKCMSMLDLAFSCMGWSDGPPKIEELVEMVENI